MRVPGVVLAAVLAGSLALAGCGDAQGPTLTRPSGPAPAPGATAGTPSGSGAARPGGGDPEGTRTVIDAAFDDARPGPVTPDAFAAAVGPTDRAAGAYDSMTFVRQADGSSSFVRTRLAAGTYLGGPRRRGDGNVLVAALEDQSADRACVAYDVRFSRRFDFSAGGKLPGLLGVAPGTSPGTPTGGGSTAHGWSGRVMWLGPKLFRAVRQAGRPNVGVTYLYHPGQSREYGDDLDWGVSFRAGEWHRVRQCYTLNTLGESDGVLRVWFDDEPVLQRSDLVYRTDPAVHVTHLDWSVFRGGDSDEWAADTAGDVDLDDLEVTVG